MSCDPSARKRLRIGCRAAHAIQRRIHAADVVDENGDTGSWHACDAELMWRRPERAADDTVCVTNGRPVGRGLRRRNAAPVQRNAERQIVLGLSLE